MTLQSILRAKGTTIYMIGPDATLAQAVQEMVRYNVGSLLVCHQEADGEPRLVGIVTERDLLRAQAAGKMPPSMHQVREVMTVEIITGSPDDAVEQVLGLMTAKRIRHLPVVREGRLLGVVSIGDLVKAQHDRLAIENRFLKDYIQQ